MAAAPSGIAPQMNVLDTAKDHVVALVGKFADGRPRTTSQTVTVACTVVEAEELWRDPHRLSVILGERGQVRVSGQQRYHWTFRAADTEVRWDSRLVSGNGGLRFTDDAGHQVVVRYRGAPKGLGTEITLTADLPAPGLLTGAAVFTALYRARALMQTGEVPTLADNPSGRR